MADAPPADRARALREGARRPGRDPRRVLRRGGQSGRGGFRLAQRSARRRPAWTDPAYRERLLRDGTAACAELGYEGAQGEYIVVLEDEPTRHNVIVCTQCSCTAWPVLGLPPDWNKSPSTAPGSRASRGRCCARWDSCFPRRWRSASGTPRPRRASWCCPSARRVRRVGAKSGLSTLVTREALIGVALADPPP